MDPVAGVAWAMARKLRIAVVSLYALENNGVRHVASALRQAGFPVTEIYFKDWVNNNFPWPEEQEVQDLIQLLRDRDIQWVGFSVRASAFHRMAKYLTERVRHALGLPILWGGMHPTFVPDKCIEIADAISIGEVDEAVKEFFVRIDEGRDHRTAPSFWVREGDVVHRNDLAPLVDLDAIPSGTSTPRTTNSTSRAARSPRATPSSPTPSTPCWPAGAAPTGPAPSAPTP